MTKHPGIFVVKPDRSLTGLAESPYDSETLLQELLARYPDLLAGDQIDPDAPRRWLLVARELGVPDQQGAADRWSLDHLFLDQDGIPTLVEVKRSSDTRIRREIVGQMLDYAANSIVHWPVERIQAEFEARCEREGHDPDSDLLDFLGTGVLPDAFWTAVKTNLQAGKVRLLFVSDAIPAELRRIVEFLNQQMDPAEVLAIEIRQFVGQGLQTLIPRVIGQTAEAAERKGPGRSGRGPRWTEAAFFAKLAERGDESERTVARALFDWARTSVTKIDFGSGTKMASFIPVLALGEQWFCPFRVFTGYRAAYMEIPLGGSGMGAPPFDDPAVKLELVHRLNAIPGIRIAEELTRFPSIELTVLASDNRLAKFLEEMQWAVGRATVAAS